MSRVIASQYFCRVTSRISRTDDLYYNGSQLGRTHGFSCLPGSEFHIVFVDCRMFSSQLMFSLYLRKLLFFCALREMKMI